jgi:hypothetical protein
MLDDFTDAITVELNRRKSGDIAIPLPVCTCECCSMPGDYYIQQCQCDCLPTDDWECSICMTPFKLVKSKHER